MSLDHLPQAAQANIGDIEGAACRNGRQIKQVWLM